MLPIRQIMLGSAPDFPEVALKAVLETDMTQAAFGIEPATDEPSDMDANLDADTADLELDPDLVRLGVKASGGVVTGKELANVIADFGADNYDQAEVVERIFAKEIARDVDGEVLKNGSSVFAPDGGIDAVIQTPDGEIPIQVKNFSDPVSDSTIEEYKDIVNAFGSTNGFADSADPSAYGMEGYTRDDWSWTSKKELRGHEFRSGLHRIFGFIRDGLVSLASRVKAVLTNLVTHVATKATAAASGFVSLSLGEQLAAIAAVLAIAIGAYYIYRWYQNRDYDHRPTDAGAPSV